MNKLYVQNKKFEKTDFTAQPLPTGDYENCTFLNCNFSNSDLSGNNFSACNFNSCNLSMVKLNKTILNEIRFTDCKLLGLAFENCSAFTFSVGFTNCVLNLSSFYKLNLKKTVFKNSSLHEVDFTEADITAGLFDNCDLFRAIFKTTNLEKADFKTAFNYSIDPENNKIKKARFSPEGIKGLLYKYDIIID